MAGIMIALLATIFIVDKATTKETPNTDWKQRLQAQTANLEQQMQNPPKGTPDRAITQVKNEIIINKYRIEHDLNPNTKTVWNSASFGANFVVLVSIFTIIIAGDAVAGEFTWGTIKLLLIRPASRAKILLSKYVATLLYSLFMLVLLFVASFVLGGIVNGFTGVSSPDVYVGSDGLAHERSMIVDVIKTYGFHCVDLLMMVTFAFMISAAFRSGLMAVAFSIGLLFAGNIIINVLSKYSWVKYVLFANTDLNQYYGGVPLRDDMTLGFSVTMLIIYFVVFNVISWTLFTKRDVAG